MTTKYAVVRSKKNGKIKGILLYDNYNNCHVTESKELAEATMANMKKFHADEKYFIVSWEE